MTNRKLHSPLRLVPKSTTLDDLERPIRTLLQKRCVFRRPPQKFEWRKTHTLIGKNDSSFWRYKTYANIRRDSPGRGRQTTVGLSRTAIFSVFAGYFSDPLEMRPALLHGDTQSVVGFSTILKCMTLNDLDWLFRVKFCFRVGLAGWDRATSENNCVKTNKGRHTESAV